jgi:hypothetical protein
LAARRHYSSDSKIEDGTEQPAKEEAVVREGEDASSPESALLTKLQAKEQEIVDLTVRIRFITSL